MKDCELIIFAKNPVLGKCKTRIAKTVGEVKALEIYQHLLCYTARVTQDLNVSKSLYYSNEIEMSDDWHGQSVTRRVQRGEDLGERMKNAFKASFTTGLNRVVIIGTDCKSITTKDINQAFEALIDHDFVVGPAQDGGYYLLGMNRFYPDLFDDVSWSTDTVLKETLRRISNLKKSVYLLPEKNDIDTYEDWIRATI